MIKNNNMKINYNQLLKKKIIFKKIKNPIEKVFKMRI